LRSQLAIAADNAVDAATQDQTFVVGDNEPSLVARLVATLPDRLVQAWSKHFDAGELHISSAFCHPRPQAHWDSAGLGPGRSELCDLLLLVASPDAAGVMTERALLIQAKCGTGGRSSLNGEGDVKQRYMYAHWPSFHIAGGKCIGPAAGCNPPARQYSFGVAGAMGTRYGIVCASGHPTWQLEPHAATWSPALKIGRSTFGTFDDVGAETVAGQLTLGEAIEQVMNKSLGHEVQDLHADDWSDVIALLLENAMDQFNAKKLTHVKHAPGALPVPLAAAASFLTNRHMMPDWLARRYFPYRHPIPFHPHMKRSRNNRTDVAGTDGRFWFYHARPHGHHEQFEDGYGIIRVVVNGRFSDDATGEPMPRDSE